jgi:Xaa-Pro aminopeptidase
MSIPFDETVESFRKLAQTSLLTLHIDIRCGVIHQLSRTLRGPDAQSPTSPSEGRDSAGLPPLDSGLYPYVLSSPPRSASPLILELNNDLIAFDSNIAAYLGAKERNFILTGLAKLVDRYLVAAANAIGVMNANGGERARIDAMVIQQNLRALLASTSSKGRSEALGDSKKTGSDPTGLGISTEPPGKDPEEDDDDSGLLVSSSRFFNLFLSGPDSVMGYVRECKAQKKDVGYTYDELRTLVELLFSAKLRGDDREEAIKAKKDLQEVLLALGEGMWDS